MNVVTTSGTRYFFGCIYGLHAPAPQDPLQWTRVRFVAPTPGAEGFVFGSSEVQSISIVFDEGTDNQFWLSTNVQIVPSKSAAVGGK